MAVRLRKVLRNRRNRVPLESRRYGKSSRIENLGDYNKVRIDLQNAGGNLDILYGKIGATAVAKAAPALLAAGAWIFYIRQKGIQLFK